MTQHLHKKNFISFLLFRVSKHRGSRFWPQRKISLSFANVWYCIIWYYAALSFFFRVTKRESKKVNKNCYKQLECNNFFFALNDLIRRTWSAELNISFHSCVSHFSLYTFFSMLKKGPKERNQKKKLLSMCLRSTKKRRINMSINTHQNVIGMELAEMKTTVLNVACECTWFRMHFLR